SKVEAGKMDIEPISFDLQLAVDEVAAMLTVRAEEKGVELVVQYPPTVPRHFIGDAGRIRQVLANLVGNAIKFTEKGQVVLGVDAEEAAAGAARPHVRVEDTGIGIPP